ncbi:uncharacterized protein LOC143282118 [Babylonia areolata]|uniref:uncharacterized protein LOC143282118 n=1 Tax=Babylonia areolata TaxID=304850 RepID=UPI003FD61143
MGKPTSSLCLPLAWLLTSPLLFCLLLPPCTVAFDLSSLLEALGGGKKQPPTCPTHCNCTTRRAEAVMQDYLSRYLPFMGVHMTPKLERQARATVTAFTAWMGSMADIQCHVPHGERVNLTDLLQASALSFKSLKLTCGQDSGVVWDLSAFDAFVNILDVSGCNLEKADSSETLAVPLNLWVLDLDDVPTEAVQSLDLSTGHAMLALSITNTMLITLPPRWSGVSLYRIMVIRLAHDHLSNYTCEIKFSEVTSLNLDHNNLNAAPLCLLDGSRYAHHISLRHNAIRELTGPLVNKTVDEQNPNPYIMYLDLAHNELETLPPLRQIEGLFSLDVSHNRLHSITTDAFFSSKVVGWLDLSNNQLEHVTDGALAPLSMLYHLNLSHNYLTSFDFDQSPLSTKIVTLDLRYNHLSYPPFADTGFVAPRLSRISAASNPFRCDCQLGVFLDFLSMLNSSRKQNWFSIGYWNVYKHDPSILQPYTDIEEFTCGQPADMKGQHLHSMSLKNECRLLSGCPALCRCELKKGEKEHVLVDCSQRESLTELPAELPSVSNASLVLYVNRSGLERLEHRPYLRHVSEIYAAHSKLSSVTPGAMEALQNVHVLSLHHNQLKSLPPITQSLTMAAATNISLGNNPWSCGCHDLWMAGWLDKHANVLHDLSSMRCRWTGDLAIDMNASDLSCEVFNYLPVVIALSSLLFLATITASLLVKYKLEVLVFLYTRFRLRPFDMYKYNQKQVFQFDIFVSFSQHDYHWVVEKLVDQLENRPRPYKLCIHLRDFPVGETIADSVSWAVNNSRCSLLVLTKDFLASEWCRHEFRAAHARLLMERDAKLLIVVHGPVDARKLDRELLAYLRTNTYLKTEDKWFWAKLEYALPEPQDHAVVAGRDREVENGAPPPVIEMDTIVPVVMDAGDVEAKA